MEIEKIDNVLESLLLLSGNGIEIEQITKLLDLQNSEVINSINRLKQKYSGDCGIHLISYNGKVQFGSNPMYAEDVAIVLNPIKEKELTKATLETIAIIAYKQPITKLEVEQIRGVSCDYTIQSLLSHNLIEVVGRKEAIGKPLLFGTTDEFLKRFALTSVGDLPDYEDLVEKLQVIERPKEGSLYNEYTIPDEEQAEEIPDFLKDEKLEHIEG